MDRTGGGFEQTNHGATKRAFPTTAFADETERFVGCEFKTDVVDGAEFAMRKKSSG